MPIPPLSRVEFFVPGKAIPQGSMSFFSGRAVQPKALTEWRHAVAGYAQVQLAAKVDSFPIWPIGPVSLTATFAIAIPPGRKNYDLYKRGKGVPDTDKLTRAIGDALEGMVYSDDAQIAHIVSMKVLAGRMAPRYTEGVTIVVEPWEEPLVGD